MAHDDDRRRLGPCRSTRNHCFTVNGWNMKPRIIWVLQWNSENELDGLSRHFINTNGLPALFRTRAEARAFANEHWGYIKTRPDLRGQPHGWRMPRAIRAKIAAIASPQRT